MIKNMAYEVSDLESVVAREEIYKKMGGNTKWFVQEKTWDQIEDRLINILIVTGGKLREK